MEDAPLQQIEAELQPGEAVKWIGRPSPKVIFQPVDALLVPFFILWGVFAIFPVFQATERNSEIPPPMLGMLLLFPLVGQYAIWGRFLFAHWKKKRTAYAITNLRVIVVQDALWRRTSSAFLKTLPTLTIERGSQNRGTTRFGPNGNVFTQGVSWDPMAVKEVPVFFGIEDVDTVYQLVLSLREQ